MTNVDDHDEKIWRFMPLSYFADLIFNKRLWFSSLKSLEAIDPAEGISDVTLLQQMLVDFNVKERIRRLPRPGGLAFELISFTDDILRNKKDTFVNCWHAKPDETFLMWGVYGKYDLPIAVSSTIKKLQNEMIPLQTAFSSPFSREFSFGKVRYGISEFSEVKSLHGDLYHAFCKRLNFAEEAEYRSVLKLGSPFQPIPPSPVVMPPDGWRERSAGMDHSNLFGRTEWTRRPSDGPAGVYVSLEPFELITEVVVAPNCGAWQLNVIQKLLRAAGGDPDIARSSKIGATVPLTQALTEISQSLFPAEFADTLHHPGGR